MYLGDWAGRQSRQIYTSAARPSHHWLRATETRPLIP